MSSLLSKLKNKKLPFFRFKKLGKKYLLTNEVGEFIFLKEEEFFQFLNGKLPLRKKGFFSKPSSFERYRLAKKYLTRNDHLFNPGPSLHIVVPTIRCNFKCIYCQASAWDIEKEGGDMDFKTAKSVVDFIFSVPNPFITIEFQGGEPLVNWPVVKYIIELSREKNKKAKKDLKITIVTNLSLMSEERLIFFRKNFVSLCTSLDGPREIHNKNRPCFFGDSYFLTTKWIKRIKTEEKKLNYNFPTLFALPTITKFSLKYPQEIVDEYLKWGFPEIHIRNLSFLGRAKLLKSEIGYSPKEFISFWKEALRYILEINERGIFFREREALILLQKILSDRNPHYTDLSSPCGAVFGQILYNFDGKILTCDEARMLKENTFCLGDIKRAKYEEIVNTQKAKIMILASCLENLSCDFCVYKPYCGVCPVKNFGYYKTPFPYMKETDWCQIKQGQLDFLFSLIEKPKYLEIFKKWVKPKPDDIL